MTSFYKVIMLVLGTPGGIRTPGLWYRKPTLYPAELRVHNVAGVYAVTD
jgi:hypothetical protein